MTEPYVSYISPVRRVRWIMVISDNVKTQFSIRASTKDELDRYKVKFKEDILKLRARTKRFVSNDDVIVFLIEHSKKKI